MSVLHDCAICMGSFPEEACKRTCEEKHTFCKGCWSEWALTSVRGGRSTYPLLMGREEDERYDVSCPVCRSVIMTEKEFHDSFVGVDTFQGEDGYRHEVPYHKGHVQGTRRSWWPSGQLRSEATWNRRPVGTAKTWFRNGQLELKEHFYEGLRMGNLYRWYESGQLKEKTMYYRGLIHGVSTTWYPNGQRCSEATYSHNHLEGVSYDWNEEGVLVDKITYCMGEIHGACAMWYPNGVKKAEYTYRYSKIHGLMKTWHENGVLSHCVFVVNGKKHGPWQKWFDNGQLESSAMMLQDVHHGLATTWNREGQKVSEIMYDMGEEIEFLPEDDHDSPSPGSAATLCTSGAKRVDDDPQEGGDAKRTKREASP